MEFFVFIINTIAVGFMGGIFYLLYFPFRNQLIKTGKLSQKRNRQINILYCFGILLLSGYTTLNGLYPSEDFYRSEFKTVTLRELPESAVFISQEASYPDFHGDYSSGSQIKLSKNDYDQLLKELQSDTRMNAKGVFIGSVEFDKVLGDRKMEDIIYSFTREIPSKEDHYQYIGFSSDGHTIFIHVTVS